MKGFFFEGYNVETVVALLGLIALLIILNEFTRANKWTATVFYGVLPIVLGILVIAGVADSQSSKTWFGVVKTYSAIAGVVGFMVIRYIDKVGKSKFAFYFPVAILALNIAEAIFKEMQVFFTYKEAVVDDAGILMLGGPWNILNALAGLFLLLSMTGWMGIKVSNTKTRDMVWADQLWFWIVAYDLWNIAYCYNCISNRAMYAGVAIIIACTLCEVFCKKGVWLQHRAQTLALFGMFSLAFDYSEFGSFGIVATHNPDAWLTLSILSLVANVAVFGYELYVIIKHKRNPLKQEMYCDLPWYKHNLEANGLLDSLCDQTSTATK